MTRGGRDQDFWNVRVRLLWMSPNAAFEVEATREAAAKIVVGHVNPIFPLLEICLRQPFY